MAVLHAVAAAMGWKVAPLAALAATLACYSPTVREGSPCDDEHPCPASLVCDQATHTCRASASPVDARVCDMGYTLVDGSCVDTDECAESTDDCSVDADCTNEPGSFACACKPGFAGDGRTCTRVCTSVLLFSDCPAPSTSCSTLTAATPATAASIELGIQVMAVPTADEAAFRTMLDGGGFDLLIFDSSRVQISQDTADRVASWVNAGGRAIVTFWNLDNGTTGQTLRTALGVSTVGSPTTPLDVYRDPTSPVDLFSKRHPVPSPLRPTNIMADDGDELMLTGAGFIAARQPSPTGAGAIAVTRNSRAITLGFLPLGLINRGDTDGDGTSDVQQLYTNLIAYLCGY